MGNNTSLTKKKRFKKGKPRGSAMDGIVHLSSKQNDKLQENGTKIKDILQTNVDNYLHEYYEKEK